MNRYFLHFAALHIVLHLLQISSIQASVSIFNATASASASPNPNFDHEAVLETGSENGDILVFRWNDPRDGILNAMIEHSTTTGNRPSWLALGFFDPYRNTVPILDSVLDSTNGQAVIGTLFFNSPTVFKYNLGNPHGEAESLNGGLQLMTGFQQTLTYTNLEQGTVWLDGDNEDGTEVIQTILHFSKIMAEEEPSSQLGIVGEAVLKEKGDNIFLWAVGPPDAETLGMHETHGAFRLDLEPFVNAEPDTGMSRVPVVDATLEAIVSSDDQFDYEVALTEDLVFRWENPSNDTDLFVGRLIHTLTDVEGTPAWLGFGFPQPTDKSNWMLMQDTFAIIGQLPSERLQKYSLGANNNHTTAIDGGFVQALRLEQQTLKASRMMQSFSDGNYITTLSFSKLLVEANSPLEAPILREGENQFLWAVGNVLTATPTIGMHRSFGGMKIDFAKVASRLDSGADIDTSNPTDALPTDTVLVGSCSSDILSDGGRSVQLTPLLGMHWILNTGIGSSIARSGSVATVTIVL